MPTNPSPTTVHPLGRFLAIAAAVVCLLITISIWRGVSTQQTLWPLPGLYFVEMVVVSFVSAFTVVRGDPLSKFVVWGAVGIFSVFSIIGSWSIGLFYLPVAIIFGVAAILADIKNKQHIVAHLGVCLIAGIAQAVLMFVAIGLLYPSVIF